MNPELSELLKNDYKAYVRVNEDRMPDGTLVPNYFIWEDGGNTLRCNIVEVTDIRPAHSLKAGGFGLRYTVKFFIEDDGGGPPKIYRKFMFLEQDKWFIERKGRNNNKG